MSYIYIYIFRIYIHTYIHTHRFHQNSWPKIHAVRRFEKLQPGRYWVWIPAGEKTFLFSSTSRPGLWPTHPPTQWVQEFLPGVKRPHREVSRSPQPSAEVNNERSYSSSPPVCLHGMDREYFVFYVDSNGRARDFNIIFWHLRPDMI